ncbi:hypothetical protein DSC45_24795 [Streptomyces sp. YIM 130001]|uniref:DUF4244 domain-containing protein n=1 Tax=Streptomyces sp. YIM 130001 TaxID=2259644 RepID=UPI000E6568F9|nr:DUF4244 domain-containing protein [Streptomyces sp. YIM 130001]RII13072.1 hypothetical protein DSC45_24795 [Streptomyces sp. YIM 130001]
MGFVGRLQLRVRKGSGRACWSRRRVWWSRLVCGETSGSGDAGMITSEYALGTVAACGFAAVLYRVVTSDTVKGALEAVIGKGLDAQF